MMTKVKSAEEIENMRSSGKMLATVLELMSQNTGVGATPKQLSALAAKELKVLGGEPAFFGYQGFPDVICISVNEEVVHGIPSDIELAEGDLVSYDFGVIYNEMTTDSAITVAVGNISSEAQKLLRTTKDAMHAGINALKDNVVTGDIGAAIEKVLSENNLGIVRDLVGHGVGHELHEDPNIPNYGRKGTGDVLKAGMTVAIEPMATLGSEKVAIADDGWTVVTTDRSLSAHFEHTALITESGSEILTKL